MAYLRRREFRLWEINNPWAPVTSGPLSFKSAANLRRRGNWRTRNCRSLRRGAKRGDDTGYNIYRAPSPTGPWTMIGSNVVDMDEGTPNKQYVDRTEDVAGPWYHRIAAFNGACGAEGPW